MNMEGMQMFSRPEIDEFSPFYFTYVSLISDGNIVSILNNQLEDITLLLTNITEEQGQFRYAPEKWSLKEVIGHMIDTERIMAYRLLCISRGEKASLPGFDEKMYAVNASFHHQPVKQLQEHLKIVRESTVALLESLDAESWIRKGWANNSEVTVRALAYIIAGHAMHHFNIIKERYINSNDFPV